MVNVLVVDDDEVMLKAMCHSLAGDDIKLFSYSDPIAALASCSHRNYNIVVTDLQMPGMDGLTLLEQVRNINPGSVRLLTSAHRDFDGITRAFNEGLLHRFLMKPWQRATLRGVFQDCLKEMSLMPSPSNTAKSTASVASASSLVNFHGMLSCDPVMHRLFEFIAKTSRSGGPFYLSGETGTGKELAARAIHLENYGPDKPFVAVNCANLSESMLESQLFGHRKGAFTGAVSDQQGFLAAANEGTLFLDEVTELPLGLQAKLLRVMQEREYIRLGDTTPRHTEISVVSAGQIPMLQAVERGAFRADLMYRLEVLPIRIPTLRERCTDILPLFGHFVQTALQRLHGRNVRVGCSPAALKLLMGYDWPGNIRELNNVAMYVCAVMDAACTEITPELLPPGFGQNPVMPVSQVSAANAARSDLASDNISAIMAANGNNKSAAARALGVSRMTLWRHLRQA